MSEVVTYSSRVFGLIDHAGVDVKLRDIESKFINERTNQFVFIYIGKCDLSEKCRFCCATRCVGRQERRRDQTPETEVRRESFSLPQGKQNSRAISDPAVRIHTVVSA